MFKSRIRPASNKRLLLAGLFLLSMIFMAGTSARSEIRITHGPILGRLSATGVGVWARTSGPGQFRVRWGRSADNLDRVSSPVATRLEDDNTGWVHVAGLAPATKYYYLVEPAAAEQPSTQLRGSFKTLPNSDVFHDPEHNPKGLFNFAFEYGCGNNQRSDISLPTFQTMLPRLKDKIDFAILNGDWIYEEKREFTIDQWRERLSLGDAEIPRLLQIAPTITGVWENYKLYLERGENLARWHRQIPSFFTFDDHELLADLNGTGTVGLRDRRAVFRDIGVQGWYDYLGWSNPIGHKEKIHFGRAKLTADSDILVDQDADFTKLNMEERGTLMAHWGEATDAVFDPKLDKKGGDPNAGVYGVVEVVDEHRLRITPTPKHSSSVSYSLGQFSHFSMRIANAEFLFLDTRSHRQLHDRRRPLDTNVSMLGPAQKKWLKQKMASSDADFFFVVSSVNLMIPHVNPRREPNKDEAWTAIAAERNELIEFWDALHKPVFVLTGDLHNSMAIKITDRVWEFASGPHNSGNHAAWAESDRPATGLYKSQGKQAFIRWSTHFQNDSKPRRQPVYTVVQVNNVMNNPIDGRDRWVAYAHPQVVFQFYNGLTGDLLYAESIVAGAQQ